MVLIIDIIVLMDKGLQNVVLLDPKLEVYLQVGITKNNLEVFQSSFEQTRNRITLTINPDNTQIC